jgi:hypothetical protein
LFLSKWHPNEPRSFHNSNKGKVIKRTLIVINDLFHVDLLMVTLQQPVKGPKKFTLERQIVVTMKGIYTIGFDKRQLQL